MSGLAAAFVAFSAVYALALWWLPLVLSLGSGVGLWRVGRDLLDQVRQLGAAGLALAAGGLVARVVWKASTRADLAGVDLDAQARRLAGAVLRRVLASRVRVRAAVPVPLRVRFRSVAGVGAGRRAVFQDPDGLWGDVLLEGDVGQIAQRLRGLPLRQLVVIGEPGAGKSVLGLMLAQQLLHTRAADEPVPVLLAVSSWNPVAESVEQFVAGRLADDFGFSRRVAKALAGEARPGVGSAWWVMPVLDGLDEIPAVWRELAVQRVEQFTALDRPVVVTCRVLEWERAQAGAGALSRAAVVRLEPLRPDDVIEFLSEPAARKPSWEPVFARLRAQPSSLLADVLATPLMAGLARDLYSRNGDPGELTAMATRSAVMARLIDGYVDVVYREGSWQRGGSSRGISVTAVNAMRWLSNLAFLADADGTRDLRWWRLPWEQLLARPARSRAWVSLWIVLSVSALAAAGGWLVQGWQAALVAGCCWVMVMVGCRAGWWLPILGHDLHPMQPRWMRRWTVGAVRVVGAGATAVVRLAFGFWCGAATGAVVGGPWVGAAVGMVAALVTALIPGRGWRPAVSSPVKTLRAVHLLSVVSAVRYGGAAAMVFALWAWLERQPVLAWSTAGLIGFAAAAMLAGGEELWLRFRILHLRAAVIPWRAASRLPLRLIGFLNDGINPQRATMRVNGAAWQFRHAVIQDHLLHHSWPVILRRHADAGDWDSARQLAKLLGQQGNLDEAIAVLRRHADADDGHAAERLAELLERRDDVGELRRRADRGDGYAAQRLARLLGQRGDVDELRRRADDGDGYSVTQLAQLLAQQGNVDELSHRAAAGDWYAARRLAELLGRQGDLDGAMAVLRRRADVGDWHAARRLAELLRQRGNLEEAMTLLRRCADAGDGSATERLAELLEQQGEIDEAIAVLRRRADAGDRPTAERLIELLRRQGDWDTAMAVLRRRADADDWYAAEQLARLLGQQGNLAELRRRADDGDGHAAWRLAELLGQRGEVEELRHRADAGDGSAAERLAELLGQRGDLEELRRRADAGDGPAAIQQAALLQRQGNLDAAIAVLRRRADADDWYAAEQLARLLGQQGNLAVLRRRTDGGDGHAARRLAELLGRRGDLEELRGRADGGDRYAVRQLAELLEQRGEVDEAIAVLRRRTDAGDGPAAIQQAELLERQGDLDAAIAVLRRRADADDWYAAERLARLLGQQGNLAEATAVLRRRTDSDDRAAAERLAQLLRQQDSCGHSCP